MTSKVFQKYKKNYYEKKLVIVSISLYNDDYLLPLKIINWSDIDIKFTVTDRKGVEKEITLKYNKIENISMYYSDFKSFRKY